MKRLIDVSHHQKQISWKKTKDVSGVIIRAGYSTTVDNYAVTNVKECKRLGIPFALYWYSYAVTDTQIESEVANFLQFVSDNDCVGVALFLDMEDADGKKASKAREYGKEWGDKLIFNMTSTFLSLLSANYRNGYVGLYASQDYYKRLDVAENQSICADLGIVRWVARWSNTAPAVLSDIWQYTNSYKWINGLQVDASFLTESMFDMLFGIKENISAPEKNNDLSLFTVQEMVDAILKR